MSRLLLFIIHIIGLAAGWLSTPLPGHAAAAYQDCVFSWNANAEQDIAGYRLYLGRIRSQLNQVMDVGNRTSVTCSESGASANGQWFSSLTAYDISGNESIPSPVMPFELTGIAEAVPSAFLEEPVSVRVTPMGAGVQLSWMDLNSPTASHRIEVITSSRPTWSLATTLPPTSVRFNSIQAIGADWACYRLRSEQSAISSDWARGEDPTDRQFCYRPLRMSTVDQPIPAPTVMPEPQSVKLIVLQAGFELTWTNANPASTATHRLEAISSTTTEWTTLALLPPSTATFSFPQTIDAAWVCLRLRDEIGRAVSLWASASGPLDRQFCYAPVGIDVSTAAPAQAHNIQGGTTEQAPFEATPRP